MTAPPADKLRIAVEGCVSHLITQREQQSDFSQGHGTLDAIYEAVSHSCNGKGWDGVDVLIIGGDFQVRRSHAIAA